MWCLTLHFTDQKQKISYLKGTVMMKKDAVIVNTSGAVINEDDYIRYWNLAIYLELPWMFLEKSHIQAN